tara:strand:+ start:19907 stop:20611 length:705 start_codon:yes stop_codon:yes gene_type:complete
MLNIKLFLDGADLDQMIEASQDSKIQGFTTNPTLMKKSGIKDYESFARKIIASIPNKPISFEVFSDDIDKMEKEARVINSWGGNTYIKIPIMNTKGDSTCALIKKLSHEGFSINITAIFTIAQVKEVAKSVSSKSKTIISIFAGRIADTGIDPVPIMMQSKDIIKDNSNAELLWASPRELLNIFQANNCGCDIITATNDVLKKLDYVGKDLTEFSNETVKMFYNDAKSAGYKLL